jgi:lysozyme
MAIVDAFLANLVADLRRDEGVAYKPYRDSEGILSIGVGRNLEDRGISDDEIDFLLANDLNWVVVDLDRGAPWWREMTTNRQRAFANMVFNLGWPRLSQFTLMLEALASGDYDEAANQALDSRWAVQVGARAERIAELFRSG